MARPLPPATVKRFQCGTVMGFYRHLLATTSDEPFYFAGQEVRGLRSKLIAAEHLFDKLSKRHKNWGDYAKGSVNLNIAPGRQYLGEAYKKLVGDFASSSGRFKGLKASTAVRPGSRDATSARITTPSRRRTGSENFASITMLEFSHNSQASLCSGSFVKGGNTASCF